MSRQQATSRELGFDTARANLLTNPGFEVWQRGVGPFTANGSISADAWMLYIAGAATLSVGRTNTIIPGDRGSRYSAVLTVTGTGGTQMGAFYNHMVKDMVMHLRGRTVTFAALVHSVVASQVYVRTWMTPGTLVSGAFHTGNNTWQWLTATCVVDAAATDIHPEVVFNAPGTIYVNAATLVIGPVAADYAPLHPQDDLARCQRYYERIGFATAAFPLYQGYHTAGGVSYGNWFFRALKPVTPTITISGAWIVNNGTVPTLNSTSTEGALLQSSIVAAGYGYTHAYSSPLSGAIAEANP